MANINITLEKPAAEISIYFDGSPWGKIGGWLLVAAAAVFFLYNAFAGVLLAGAGIFCLYKWYKDVNLVSDSDIDRAWAAIAVSREDEAYRVSHLDKEDAIRPAQWFYTFPDQFDEDVGYKTKEGKDEFIRQNHQRLVYMIFAKDQMIIFEENIGIENLWDSADKSEEYYWQDVSSVSFDQRDDTLTIVCGPKTISYPLTADDGAAIRDYMKQAEEISSAVRMILREKKTR